MHSAYLEGLSEQDCEKIQDFEARLLAAYPPEDYLQQYWFEEVLFSAISLARMSALVMTALDDPSMHSRVKTFRGMRTDAEKTLHWVFRTFRASMKRARRATGRKLQNEPNLRLPTFVDRSLQPRNQIQTKPFLVPNSISKMIH